MTEQQKLAIKAEIEANPHLFSARKNRDFDTMAAVLNDTREAADKLTPLQCHECMDAVAPAAEEN